MSIWFADKIEIGVFKNMNANTIVEYLGIEFTEIASDYIVATMPVDHRTVQPFRVLHGGASVVLAETLGSCASFLVVDANKYYCVGQTINANHIKSAKEGEQVIATAKPIHLGRSSHVWNIEIKNERNELVCISRLTMAVIPLK